VLYGDNLEGQKRRRLMKSIDEIVERIKCHLEVPCCRTLTGLRIHLAAIGLAEMWQLCFWLKCRTPKALERKMWRLVRDCPRK
jgi:hypothetical protein